MKSKDEYIQSLASELTEWSAQIDLLVAKAEAATAEAKLKYADELTALRAKQNAAAVKLDELRESSGDAWETAKETAHAVWADLKTGLANATANFK